MVSFSSLLKRANYCSIAMLALALPAVGGAGGPGLPMRVVVAPPKPVAGVATLAIGDFSGFNGSVVAGGIAQALQDAERSLPENSAAGLGKALVGVAVDTAGSAAGAAIGGVAGKATDKLVSGAGELLVDQIGKERVRLDDGLRVDVIRVATDGADATITGKIDVSSKDEAYKAKQAKVDAKGNVVKDSAGKIQYQEIDCTKRTTTTTLTWKVLDKSGAELVAGADTDSASDSKCEAERSAIASQDTLAASALGNPGVEIVNTFVPAWKDFRIDLDRTKAIENDIKVAQQGSVMLAACGMRRAMQEDSYNPEILYSLGGLMEAMGDMEAATQQYTKAIGAGHKGAARSMERVRKRQMDLKVLRENYGLSYTVAAVSWDGCPAMPEGHRTETKRDVELMSQASGGTKVAALPKGMEVYVQSSEGEMTHVKLVGGDEGWVVTKAVK